MQPQEAAMLKIVTLMPRKPGMSRSELIVEGHATEGLEE
jgi:hypothetical protein